MLCVPAFGLCLSIAAISHHIQTGLLAATGAIMVGFGSFMRIGGSAARSMVVVAIGVSTAFATGAMLGGNSNAFAFVLFVLALFCVFAARVDDDVWAASMQVATAFLLASALQPPGWPEAMSYALAVLAGASLQCIAVIALRRWVQMPIDEARVGDPGDWVRDLSLRAREGFVLNLIHSGWAGTTVVISLLVAQSLHLPNPYWAPMTSLYLLKANSHTISGRGLERSAGTLLGAAVAISIGAVELPLTATIAMCIVLSWLALAVPNPPYWIFSSVITAFVILMLSLSGAADSVTAWHRLVATLLGVVIAIASELLFPHSLLARLLSSRANRGFP